MLSLVFFVSPFVVISSISAVDMFAILCLFLFSTWFCVFIANFFGKHFQSPCYLYCYAQDGLYPLKLRARYRFLGYIRRLGQKIDK